MTIVEKLRLYLFPRTVYTSKDGMLKVIDRIENKEPVRVLYADGERESGMFLEETKKAEPLFYYMRTFRDICTKYEGIHHVLMIGGAGLSFARIFLQIDQRNTMTAIEKDARCIEIADKCFDIHANKRLNIIVMPGEQYIAEAVQCNKEDNALYDAIIIDAFNGKKIAKELTSESVLKMSRILLRSGGIYVMNVINEKGGQISMHTFLTETFLKNIFSNTKILECENEGNCVLIASDRNLD